MPDKPTDKKLSFMEWLAWETKKPLILYKEALINPGVHNGKCVGKKEGCVLCELENLLSEYHKYFKQK